MYDEFKSKQKFNLGTPADYRIVVEGFLDERWADRLAGLQISSRKRGDDLPETTLSGRLRDQAELAGVLNSLYELHLPILRVEVIGVNEK